jgi:hypothetical protein
MHCIHSRQEEGGTSRWVALVTVDGRAEGKGEGTLAVIVPLFLVVVAVLVEASVMPLQEGKKEAGKSSRAVKSIQPSISGSE